MANLYKYAPSNTKTGYFLRGRSKTSGYYNLQTTPAANRLFEQLDYNAGRLQHTEGDSVPGELTWRMYQAGLLETDNPNSTRNNLSDVELKETFEASNEHLSLSESDLETLQSFIESYSGPGKAHVTKLNSLLDTSNESNTSDTNTHDNDESTDVEMEIITKRTNAANTSLDEIQTRIKKIDNRDNSSCLVTVQDITSQPSGPQSFTQFWNAPARLLNVFGIGFYDTFTYTIQYSTDTIDDTQFWISDFSIFDAPEGIDSGLAGSFAAQDSSRPDTDYTVGFSHDYSPRHTPGEEEFTLYLGEQPTVIHTVHIKNGHIDRWNAEVTEHEWSQYLQLLSLREAATYVEIITSFFDEFDGYSLESPVNDFNELSINFTVRELNTKQRQKLREATES